MNLRGCCQSVKMPNGWHVISFNMETGTPDYLGGHYPSRRKARERLTEFKDRDAKVVFEDILEALFGVKCE